MLILILTSTSSSGIYLALAKTYPIPPMQATNPKELAAELNKIKTLLGQEDNGFEPYATKIINENKELADIADEKSIRSGGGLKVKYKVKITIKGEGLKDYEAVVFSGFLDRGENGINGWTITIPKDEAKKQGSYVPKAFKDYNYIPYILRIADQITGQELELETKDINMYQAITIIPKGEATKTYLKQITVRYNLSDIKNPETTLFTIPVTPSGLQYLKQYISEKFGERPSEIERKLERNNYLFAPYIVIKSYSRPKNGWYGEANIAGILSFKTLEPEKGDISTKIFVENLKDNIKNKLKEILNSKLSSIDDDDLKNKIINEALQKIDDLDLSKIIGEKWTVDSNLGYDSIEFNVDINVKIDIEKAACSCKTIEITQGNKTIEKIVCEWKVSKQSPPEKRENITKQFSRTNYNIGGYPKERYTELIKQYWNEYLAYIVGNLASKTGQVTDHFYHTIVENREDPRSKEGGVKTAVALEEKTYTYKPYFIDSQWVKNLLYGKPNQAGEKSRVMIVYTLTKGKGEDIPEENLYDDRQVQANSKVSIGSNLDENLDPEKLSNAEAIGWFTVGINLYSLPGYFRNDIFDFFVQKDSSSLEPSSLADVQSKGYYKVLRDNEEWTEEVTKTIVVSGSSEGGIPSEGSSCSQGEDPRYSVSVKANLKFHPPIPQDFVYRSEYKLMAKQVKEPVVIIDTEVGELEGEASVTGDVILVPSMAPLLGNGFLDKVNTLMDELGVDNKVLEEFLSPKNPNDDFVVNFFSNIMPSYIPIPTPKEVALNRYAKGEYLGFYMVTGRIKNIIVPPVGIPLVTFFYESWDVTYTGAGGVLHIDLGDHGPTIELKNKKEITVTSLGIGIGEIFGKSIGKRLYIVPSKTLESLDNYDSNTFMAGILGFIKDLKNSLGKILDITEKAKIFPGVIRDIESIFDLPDKGAYIQVMPYIDSVLNDREGLWPYIIFTVNNMDRFIIDKSGELSIITKGIDLRKYFDELSKSGENNNNNNNGNKENDQKQKLALDFNPRIYMLHIRILKVPGIGIPIPLIIPIYLKLDKINEKKVEIDVYKIGVEPLLLIYDTASFNEKKKYDIGSLLESYLHNSSVKLYAVPVWIDEKDNPVAPVLLRGPYNVGLKRSNGLIVESSLALKLYYMRGSNHRNATMLSIVSVTDIGIPLEFLTVPYSKLYQLAKEEENGKLVIEPAWYASGILSVASLGSGEKTMKGHELSIVSTKAFNIIESNNNLIIYVGAKSNESLLVKLGIKDVFDKMEKEAKDIREKVEEINDTLNKKFGDLEKVITNVSEFLNDDKNNPINLSGMSDVLQSLENKLLIDVKELVDQIAKEVVESIAEQIMEELVEMTIIALIPDPFGVTNFASTIVEPIMKMIKQSIESAVQEYIDKIFGGGSGGEKSATDLVVKRLLSYIVVYTVGSVGKDFVGNVVKDSLLKGAKNLLEKTRTFIDTYTGKAVGYLSAVILAMNKLKAMAMYKPLLVSKIYMFNGDGQLVYAETYLGKNLKGDNERGNYMTAIDMLEIGDPSSEKLVLIQPYSVLISGLSKIINGLFGGNTKLPNVVIDVPGALRYTSAWLNYVIDVKNSFTKSQTSKDIPDKLLEISDEIRNANSKIEKWVVLNSIDINAVLVPTYLYIPPTTINTQPQAKS